MNDEALTYLEENVWRLANAITPINAMAGKDASGGTVTSLTEAVMGITSGLMAVAAAIEMLADAVEESGKKS